MTQQQVLDVWNKYQLRELARRQLEAVEREVKKSSVTLVSLQAIVDKVAGDKPAIPQYEVAKTVPKVPSMKVAEEKVGGKKAVPATVPAKAQGKVLDLATLTKRIEKITGKKLSPNTLPIDSVRQFKRTKTLLKIAGAKRKKFNS